MAIRGSLQEAGLPDVIQMLHLGRRSGCLALTDRGRHASVFFDEGWVVDAVIVNRPDRLGDLLVRAGLVTIEQLEDAIRLQSRHRGQRIGEVLVSQGAVTERDLNQIVRKQVEEAVFSLFGWRSGSFSFEPGVEPDRPTTGVRIPPDMLLLEGARRVDEWAIIEKKVPSFDLIFARDPGHREGDPLAFTRVQQQLLSLLDGRRDVRDLVEETGLLEFEACQALYGLLSAGVIHRVGTSTPGPSARSREAQIEEHRNLGVAFYKTGMLDEAAREFRRVMELRPAEGFAPFHLGLVAARESRWADAVYFFQAAADRAGPRPSILLNLGVALGMVGESAQSDTALEEVAARAPENAGVFLAWGVAALSGGLLDTAEARLERARVLAGETLPPVWYWAVARTAALQGDLERALALAREAGERWPENAVLVNNYCVLLEAAGDLVTAERELMRILEIEPGIPQISKNLGDVLYRQGRFDEAWASYARVVRLSPELGDDLHFRMGNLALRRGDADLARTHWERALRLNPGHQLARANLQTLGS